MNMRLFFMLFSILLACTLAAQERGGNRPPPTTVGGIVQDASNGQLLPYATVAIYKKTGELISGTTTDESGAFSLMSRRPRVRLTVSFMGYVTDTIKGLTAENGLIDAGVIKLRPNQELLDEVVIEGEVSRTTFELDKRVFNVGKDLSSTGASAMEVLNNVPSVNVNIEGEISLRGNTGVQILIDGKPSVLSDGQSNALGSITADMIDRIEVITNPSAKYEAAGTSGILNIILRKDEKKGINGSISLNTGIPDNHSIGFSMNSRTEKFNLFAQLGAGYRSLPRFSESINENRISGVVIESEGEAFRNENFYNIRLGTDYYIDKLNVVTLSGNFAYEIEDSPSETNFMRTENEEVSRWVRRETTEATNPKWQFDLQYKKEFKDNKEHTLITSALGSFFGKDQTGQFSNPTSSGSFTVPDQRANTNFQRADYTFKLDYVRPVSEKTTIEAGGQYEFNDVGNDFEVSNLIDGSFVSDANLTNDFNFDQKVLGLYGTYSYEGKKAGVKLGLRMETTDLMTLLTTTDERNKQDYTNFFPSLSSSYTISERLSLQASYSRRIRRPRLWDLNPFFNITNNFNIRTGNPNLLPEFTDSYELTSIYIHDKYSLNGSVYYSFTTDVVERVSLFENNVNTTTPRNIGTNSRIGLELNGKYKVKRGITLNGDANFNFFDRKGEFQERTFDFSGEQWSSRLTAKFKLPKDFSLELSGRYRSGVETVQGKRSGFASADFGLRKKILKGKIIASLGVRDVFASRIGESIIDQDDFYLYSFSQRGRFITFGLSYGFGKGEAMAYSGGRRRR